MSPRLTTTQTQTPRPPLLYKLRFVLSHGLNRLNPKKPSAQEQENSNNFRRAKEQPEETGPPRRGEGEPERGKGGVRVAERVMKGPFLGMFEGYRV